MAIPALLGILLAAAPYPTWAGARKGPAQSRRTIPFSQAQVRIEVNATDGDAGLHVFLDARAWKSVKIFDPRWELIFEVEGGGSVRKTGLTELFFESADSIDPLLGPTLGFGAPWTDSGHHRGLHSTRSFSSSPHAG